MQRLRFVPPRLTSRHTKTHAHTHTHTHAHTHAHTQIHTYTYRLRTTFWPAYINSLKTNQTLSLSPVQYFVVCWSQCAETADDEEHEDDEQKSITFVDSLSQWKNLFKNIHSSFPETKLFSIYHCRIHR